MSRVFNHLSINSNLHKACLAGNRLQEKIRFKIKFSNAADYFLFGYAHEILNN